ncbi:MAG: RIP metalloprotease RseP [Spirochaetaceae bacterium]|jgi:regulator of sigma E protease|nr:RIP metalloprotease RseP [Spirochaetaceae bacterium]
MLIIKLLLGLVGLGIVVFVHELGHFLIARIVGIKVTAFSLGWGPPALHKTIKGVDYRLGFFPVGGYCKMAGEGEFQKAWEDGKQGIRQERGTFYGESPPRRMAAVAAGPIFNILFAALVFSVMVSAGSEYRTLPSRIVLERDINGKSRPADRAGLQSGDVITSINGKKTETYHDIQEIVALSAKKPMRFTVLRGGETAGETLDFVIEPELEKDTGAGRIGVYFWNDPVIESVEEGGAAERAGLLPGDRIVELDGQPFPYTAALSKIYPEGVDIPDTIPIVYERGGERREAVLSILPSENPDGVKVGITWASITHKTPPAGFFAAIAGGSGRAVSMFAASARGLTMLFRGVNVTKAVSGPVRISYMVGDIAAAGFARSPSIAVRSFFEFIAFISIALALMNLLPLPILDGGMFVLFLIEAFMHRPLHPRVFVAFQTAGIIIIGGLMILSVYSDIMFFIRK